VSFLYRLSSQGPVRCSFFLTRSLLPECVRGTYTSGSPPPNVRRYSLVLSDPLAVTRLFSFSLRRVFLVAPFYRLLLRSPVSLQCLMRARRRHGMGPFSSWHSPVNDIDNTSNFFFSSGVYEISRFFSFLVEFFSFYVLVLRVMTFAGPCFFFGTYSVICPALYRSTVVHCLVGCGFPLAYTLVFDQAFPLQFPPVGAWPGRSPPPPPLRLASGIDRAVSFAADSLFREACIAQRFIPSFLPTLFLLLNKFMGLPCVEEFIRFFFFVPNSTSCFLFFFIFLFFWVVVICPHSECCHFNCSLISLFASW